MDIVRVGGLPRALKTAAVLAVIVAACAIHTRAVAAAPSGRLWFIFVDDLHVDFRSSGYLRALLRTICRELVEDGDLVGSVSTGPSSLVVDLTYDRERVLDRLGRSTGAALSTVDVFRISQAPQKTRDELLYRAAVAVTTAHDVVRRLAQVHNLRKAFIYVSNGYYIDLSGAGRGSAPAGTSLWNLSGSQVREQLSALLSEARGSNLRMFAVDSHRLPGGAQNDPRIDTVWWQNYWALTRISLRAISERTDGFALLEEDDLSDGLKRINATMRN